MEERRGRRIVALLAVVSVGACLAAVAPQGRAARRAVLPACSRDMSPTGTTYAHRVGKDVVGTTALGTWGTSACSLQEHLTFAVATYSAHPPAGGPISSIVGNPRTKTLDVVFRPGHVLVYSWRWENWCGRQGRFAFQGTWRGDVDQFLVSQSMKAPACVSRKEKSSLSAIRLSIATCSAGDYKATTDLGEPIMTRLIDFVQITPRGLRAPCLLKQVHIQFAVQGRVSGKWTNLSGIAGSPAARVVGGMLTPDSGAAFVFWAWSNWCGGGDAFRAWARVARRSVSGPSRSQGATCEDSGVGSTLTPSYGHVP